MNSEGLCPGWSHGKLVGNMLCDWGPGRGAAGAAWGRAGGQESLYDVTFVWKDEWDIAGKVYSVGGEGRESKGPDCWK